VAVDIGCIASSSDVTSSLVPWFVCVPTQGLSDDDDDEESEKQALLYSGHMVVRNGR
jgi:hypothetical protein